MTVRFDIHERVSLNLMGSVSVLSTPWAQWGVSCGDDEWCEEPEGGTYRYMKSGKSNVGLYRLQLGPYFQVTNQFAAFAGASLQNSVGNIALHNDSSSRTDLFGDPFVDGSYNYAVGYAGVAYQHHSGFYLQGQVFVSNDERTSPTGGQLTLGLQL